MILLLCCWSKKREEHKTQGYFIHISKEASCCLVDLSCQSISLALKKTVNCKGQICKSSSSPYVVLYTLLEEDKMQKNNKEACSFISSFIHLCIYLFVYLQMS